MRSQVWIKETKEENLSEEDRKRVAERNKRNAEIFSPETMEEDIKRLRVHLALYITGTRLCQNPVAICTRGCSPGVDSCRPCTPPPPLPSLPCRADCCSVALDHVCGGRAWASEGCARPPTRHQHCHRVSCEVNGMACTACSARRRAEYPRSVRAAVRVASSLFAAPVSILRGVTRADACLLIGFVQILLLQFLQGLPSTPHRCYSTVLGVKGGRAPSDAQSNCSCGQPGDCGQPGT